MSQNRFLSYGFLAAVALAGVLAARTILMPTEGNPDAPARPVLEFVAGGPGQFHAIAVQGAEKAADAYDVELRVHVPDNSEPETQISLLSGVDTQTANGVAVAPMAGVPAQMLSRLASGVKLVTYDSDSPQSLRQCHIGTNNFAAGNMSARLVREALPDGGKVALFIGDQDRENSVGRRAGFYQDLLRRYEGDPAPEDPLDQPVEGGGFTIVATYLDGGVPEECEMNIRRALDDHPDLKAVVGLYGYVGPAAMRALGAAEKLGDVEVVAFDEHDETLQGIIDGHIHGTVVQDPYQYGYESVRLLASLVRQRAEEVPLAGAGTLYLPCTLLRSDNVEEYRDKLGARLRAVSQE